MSYQKLGDTGLFVRAIGEPSVGTAVVELSNEPGQLWNIRINLGAPYIVLLVRNQ